MTAIINQYGVAIDFEAAVALMDDDIRETLHAEGIDDVQEFFDRYTVAHADKFGETWALDDPNPTY